MSRAQSIAAIVFALAAGACGASSAQEAQRPLQAQDERPAAAPQPRHEAAARDGKPAPKMKVPLRRRSVQQIIATVPAPAVAPSYGPVLAPAPAPAAPPVYPPPPAQINSCSGAQCTDSSGNTYGTGTGNAAIDSQGRLCNRVGNTMQCF